MIPSINDGEGSYGQPDVVDWGGGEIHLGKFVAIGPGVTFMVGGHHRSDTVSGYPFGGRGYAPQIDVKAHIAPAGDILIGNDVWIGQGAVILSPSTIEDGAIIGAFSVLRGTVSAYAVYVGNPAQFKRYRFGYEQALALLEIRWWDWEPDVIRQRAADISGDVGSFIKKYLTP